jgi:uncharacterized protein YbaR (Trm112 family)
VVLFGWRKGDAADLGEVVPVLCPSCRTQVFLHHVRTEQWVSLYYGSTGPPGANEYLICPTCRAGLAIRPEQQAAVDQMQLTTAMYRRGVTSPEAYRGLVERFWQAMGVVPSGEQVVHAPATVPPVDPAKPGLPDRIADLARLHADGVLTDEEFSAAKRRLIDD